MPVGSAGGWGWGRGGSGMRGSAACLLYMCFSLEAQLRQGLRLSACSLNLVACISGLCSMPFADGEERDTHAATNVGSDDAGRRLVSSGQTKQLDDWLLHRHDAVLLSIHFMLLFS